MKYWILVIHCCVLSTSALFNGPNGPLAILQGLNGFGFNNGVNPLIKLYNPSQLRGRCPICDHSVYSYCALFNGPNGPLAILQGLNGFGFNNGVNPLIKLYNPSQLRGRCPICDHSVYSYCGDKLFHDSCCCSNPNNPYEELPHQCIYADCSFLHSNSCVEHKLITACCCGKK